MSSPPRNDGMSDDQNTGSIEYNVDGEMLTEVEVSDDLPPDDDEESIWTDDGDDVEENEEEEEALGRSTRFTGHVDDMAVCAFGGHTDSVYCAAIHPFTKRTVITGGGDDCAFIWSYADTGEVLSVLPLKGHTDTVTSVGFNFDGTLALTGSYDGTVRIWEVLTGVLKQTLEGPEDVEFASWHSKGNALIAGSKDGTVWMWLAHNGQCVQVFAGHDGGVTCGAFSKEGNLLFTGGEDGTVRLWAAKTGKCKHVFDGPTAHQGMVTCIAGSEDGDLIMTGSVDGKVLLLQISGKKILQTFVHSKPKALGADGMPLPPPPKHPTQSQASASAEDAEELGFGDFDPEEDEEDEEGTMSVECVGFSRGSFRWAASGGLDKTLKVWDIATGSCRSVCPHGDSVVSLKWHSSLPIISTAALDHIVRVWDARAGTLLLELTGHRDLVTSIEMCPIPLGTEGDEVSCSNSGEVATDMLVSVSDDHTSRVFYFAGQSLLS